MNDPKIIVALDFDDLQSVKHLIKQLNPSLCRLKIGKELFTSFGPQIVDLVQSQGFEVFLDLKFHDIPVTTAKACKAAANLGVWMVNVHALGGPAMLAAAREAIDASHSQTKLIAVTILTSINQSEINKIGIQDDIDTQVNRLATLAFDAALDGVVCSAQETEGLRKKFGDQFLLVTPGIRPAGVALNDQKRAVTPVDAIENGSSYLVIGRPITQAENPLKVLTDINESIKNKLRK
ncbi:MAG TPA: orotidine-5'-phosphate decarboxylase [Gammaproteobacteria bacterium]|nr:orotidine-5'-phosphate decarboxylase [Gammaproteobacteria bacterium]